MPASALSLRLAKKFRAPFRACCRLVIPLAMLAAAAHAQVNPQRPPEMRLPSGGSLYSIEGRVMAADEFTPVNNVRITLYDLRGFARGTQQTDDQGIFAFYDLPPGSYRLTARHGNKEEQSFEVDLSFTSRRDLRLVLAASRLAGKPSSASPRPLPAWMVKIPPRARKSYDAGLRALAAKNYKQSRVHFEEAIELYPDYASAHSALGTALLGLKNRDQAIAAFAAALKLDPHLLDACITLGALYNAEKKFTAAQPLLLTARRLRAADWRIHYQLGENFAALQDWPHAEESLRETARLHAAAPPRVDLLLINALVRQDKYPEALAAMNHYLERFPNDSFATQVRAKRDALREQLQPPATPPKP